MGHRTGRGDIFQCHADGAGFGLADPDWKHLVALFVAQDDDVGIIVGIEHQAFEMHLRDHRKRSSTGCWERNLQTATGTVHPSIFEFRMSTKPATSLKKPPHVVTWRVPKCRVKIEGDNFDPTWRCPLALRQS